MTVRLKALQDEGLLSWVGKSARDPRAIPQIEKLAGADGPREKAREKGSNESRSTAHTDETWTPAEN